jgi:hypothetical protein
VSKQNNSNRPLIDNKTGDRFILVARFVTAIITESNKPIIRYGMGMKLIDQEDPVVIVVPLLLVSLLAILSHDLVVKLYD